MSRLDESARDLSPYVGWYARPWEYSVSHRRLVLRFNLEQESVYLVMSLCDRFSLIRNWRVVRPRCEQNGEVITFSDDGIEVVCEFVYLTRDLRDSRVKREDVDATTPDF